MCTYICRFVIPMRKISYTVPPALDGSSVAAVLRSHGFSTALLRSLKKTYDALCRNDCPVRTVDPVHTGDIVAVELNTGGATAPPSAEKAVIVYADRDILVVNKRAGMAMYETYNHHGNALSNAVAAAGFDGPFRPIYRLDKDTSGLVVLARPAERRQAGRSGTKGLLCGGARHLYRQRHRRRTHCPLPGQHREAMC